LPWTNIPAYNKKFEITDVKSVITLGPEKILKDCTRADVLSVKGCGDIGPIVNDFTRII